MGILAQIDMALQKDLIEYVKEQDKKPYPHTLGDVLMNEILKDIIKGDARISGCVTNHGKKIMYLEITFYDMKESEGVADDGSVQSGGRGNPGDEEDAGGDGERGD